jgi:hypothetical protein
MTTQVFRASQPFRTAPDSDVGAESQAFTVPYAGQVRMRLTIMSGMADAHLRIDPNAGDLIAIDHGDGISPRLRVSESELRVSWPTTIGSWLRAALAGECRHIEIVLHPAVEWTLLVRGGMSRLQADLAAGSLARVEISGGVSDACFDLPASSGIVPIRISGGASDLALRRPADTGVAIAVSGGISGLQLDDQAFEAIGGGARLTSGLVQGDAPHYALELSGGASDLHVVRR